MKDYKQREREADKFMDQMAKSAHKYMEKLLKQLEKQPDHTLSTEKYKDHNHRWSTYDEPIQ